MIDFILNFPCFSALAVDCSNPFTTIIENNLAFPVFLNDGDILKLEEAIGPILIFDNPDIFKNYIDSLPNKIKIIAFYSDELIGYVSPNELYEELKIGEILCH